jgi:hypothetical protein
MLLITKGEIARLSKTHTAHTNISGKRDSGNIPRSSLSTDTTNESGMSEEMNLVFIDRLSFTDG